MTSEKYRLMIYFISTTILIYSKDLIADETSTVSDFIKNNKELTTRVFQEAINIFQYEPSGHQMEVGIGVYLQGRFRPDSVKTSEPFKLQS